MSEVDYALARAAAAARVEVFLVDGRTATLVCWKRDVPRAKVRIGGHHVWIDKADIVWPHGALRSST